MTAWKINRKQLEKQENHEIMEGLKSRNEEWEERQGKKKGHERQIL